MGSGLLGGSTATPCFSERSMGLATSSKLEVSSPDSGSLSSVNLVAKSLMEEVCSFIEGGGPRRADVGSGAGSGSTALLVGEGAFGDAARTAGL